MLCCLLYGFLFICSRIISSATNFFFLCNCVLYFNVGCLYVFIVFVFVVFISMYLLLLIDLNIFVVVFIVCVNGDIIISSYVFNIFLYALCDLSVFLKCLYCCYFCVVSFVFVYVLFLYFFGFCLFVVFLVFDVCC